MPVAELVTVKTSRPCVSYRLYVAGDGLLDEPRVVWSNRVEDRPEGHAAARVRAKAWAARNGYRIVERREVVKRPEQVAPKRTAPAVLPERLL